LSPRGDPDGVEHIGGQPGQLRTCVDKRRDRRRSKLLVLRIPGDDVHGEQAHLTQTPLGGPAAQGFRPKHDKSIVRCYEGTRGPIFARCGMTSDANRSMAAAASDSARLANMRRTTK